MKYLATALFCLAASCGGDPVVEPMPMDMGPPSAYACDQTTASQPTCKEFTNISANQMVDGLQGLCSVQLTAGLCPRPNLLGGCRAANANYTLTTWFYPGATYMNAGQVMTFCGSAFVPPN